MPNYRAYPTVANTPHRKQRKSQRKTIGNYPLVTLKEER